MDAVGQRYVRWRLGSGSINNRVEKLTICGSTDKGKNLQGHNPQRTRRQYPSLVGPQNVKKQTALRGRKAEQHEERNQSNKDYSQERPNPIAQSKHEETDG